MSSDLSKLMLKLQQTVEAMDPTLIAIAVAIVVVLATIAFFVLRATGGGRGNRVLLCGLPDSGKTHMYAKLASKKTDSATPIHTYTSFKENIYTWNVENTEVCLIDYPGAERLRKYLIDKYLRKDRASLRGIVFVVDSATFGKRSRDVAEFLYDVIAESGKKIPIMVSCNKQDSSVAKSVSVIQSTLEKEIGLINKTRAAALTSTDGSVSRNTLTDTGDEFSWEDLPTKIDFVECAAVESPSANLDKVRSWILNR